MGEPGARRPEEIIPQEVQDTAANLGRAIGRELPMPRDPFWYSGRRIGPSDGNRPIDLSVEMKEREEREAWRAQHPRLAGISRRIFRD